MLISLQDETPFCKSPVTLLEGGMLLYSIYALIQAISYNDYGIMPLTLFLLGGYAYVFLSSVFHWNKTQKALVLDVAAKQLVNHE